MSDRVSNPTTNLLELELTKLTRWQLLGLFLGLDMAEIKEVELNHHELARRRMEVFDKWIRKEGTVSWVMMVEALEKMSELALASQLREKYCSQQCKDDGKPQMSMSEHEELQTDLQTTERVLKMDRKEMVATELERLEEKYLRLVINIESAVSEANPPVMTLKRFSKYYTSSELRTVEELFDYLQQYCFLDTTLLQKIISFFLDKIHLLNSELSDYIQQLEDFKSSTTLKQFMESIETAQQPLTIASETSRTCTVTLKLVGGWLEKTITDLDKLLKVLFQDKSSVLTHLKIVRGSVIITYLAPRSQAIALIMIARSHRNISFMTMVGVCALQIGDTVVTSIQNELLGFSFESSLIRSVKDKDIDVLCFLLNINTSPDAANDDGYTALIWGSHLARKKIVRFLIKAKASQNLQARNGISPLHVASNNGHSDVVRMLLKANADPNIQENDGATPLIIASQKGHFNVVRILLENNADPNLQAGDGGTPLYIASYGGHTGIVDLLLKANADPNLQTDLGVTPLIIACLNRHFNVVSLLLENNADPNHQAGDDCTLTPLYIASYGGHTGIADLLLKANADPNLHKTDRALPLYAASQNGHSDVVSVLLKANADPNIQGNLGATPLIVACLNGHFNVVCLLLENNAEPNHQAGDGRTSLYIASSRGHTKIVDLLLKANADPNIQANDGATPLIMASMKGHFNVVGLLLENNADPNHHAGDGGTPLISACLKCHSQIVQLLLTSGADPNLRRSTDYTALMCACRVGCLESVELLLVSGADLSLQTPGGPTALDVAAFGGHEDIVDLIHAVELSQSSSTSPVLTSKKIAANVDIAAMSILNKAMEKMLGKRTESFISAQYKIVNKILPSKDLLKETPF